PRSLVPVVFAAATATSVRIALVGGDPVFAMPDVIEPGPAAMAIYATLGALVGLVAIAVTKLVYAIEDGFERLPVHWMWWPAIGAVAVGAVGVVAPHTLGVGYDNIHGIVNGQFALGAVLTLCAWKLVSW